MKIQPYLADRSTCSSLLSKAGSLFHQILPLTALEYTEEHLYIVLSIYILWVWCIYLTVICNLLLQDTSLLCISDSEGDPWDLCIWDLIKCKQVYQKLSPATPNPSDL